MYAFFYLENNERFPLPFNFSSAEAALAYWQDKRATWQQIDAPKSGDDQAAFLNPVTGDIVVLRRLADGA